MAGPLLPEVRLVRPGEVLRLCRCGACRSLPEAAPECPSVLLYEVRREQRLLLCRCGRSAELPWCDGSHAPAAPGWREKWRRFRSDDSR